jgi:hypothetical protein
VEVATDPKSGLPSNNVIARRYIGGTAGPAQLAPAPAPMVAPKDPIADYYNKLRDYNPATDDQQIKNKIRKEMQSSLDAIDQKYVSIFANEERDAGARMGATRAGAARSGTLQSDFGDSHLENTRVYNKQSHDAVAAAKSLEIQGVYEKITQLAKDQIEARKQEALGRITGIQKLQADARNLVPVIGKSGAQLTPAQKQALMEQTGYDPLTLESILNASKPQPEYFAPMQMKDGSLVIVDKQGNVNNLGKYDLPPENEYQFVFSPDGTPFVFDKNTGKAEIAANFREGQFARPTTVGRYSRVVDTGAPGAPTITNPLVAPGAAPRSSTPRSSNPGLIGPPAPGKTPAKGSLTSKQLSRVKQIIAANPGEYGMAAQQIDREFGAGTATKADTLLRSSYMIPSDAADIVNRSGQPPTIAAWNAGRQKFINDHSYNPTAAAQAYDRFVKKPSASSSTSTPGIKP